jgi:acyl carrier protein phosphodiesterase
MLVPFIFDELLPSYGEIKGIGRALERMSRRVTRDNPLAGGETELQRNYDGFHADFQEFMPQVKSYVAEFDFSIPS